MSGDIPDRIARLARMLLADLSAVDDITYGRSAGDQQRLGLIVEAFERVGEVAIEDRETARTLALVEAFKALGPQATLITDDQPSFGATPNGHSYRLGERHACGVVDCPANDQAPPQT